MVMAAQHCEFIKCQQIVQFKIVNFMLYELHLKKKVMKVWYPYCRGGSMASVCQLRLEPCFSPCCGREAGAAFGSGGGQ